MTYHGTVSALFLQIVPWHVQKIMVIQWYVLPLFVSEIT